MALFCLRTGISVLTTASPIIGPPVIILPGSALKPPQKSIISPTFMPIGTRTFFGSAIAEPSTVSERLTSGLPLLRYLAINATEATFITTQPTSAGNFPGGTFLPVAESTIIFSAPWGYFDFSVMRRTALSSATSLSAIALSTLKASGLLSSAAITTRLKPSISFKV